MHPCIHTYIHIQHIYIHIYIYICIHMYMLYVYIYIYIYIYIYVVCICTFICCMYIYTYIYMLYAIVCLSLSLSLSPILCICIAHYLGIWWEYPAMCIWLYLHMYNVSKTWILVATFGSLGIYIWIPCMWPVMGKFRYPKKEMQQITLL